MSARSTKRSRPFVLALRTTAEETAVIGAAAKAEGVSVAEFCRRAAVDRSALVVQEDRP